MKTPLAVILISLCVWTLQVNGQSTCSDPGEILNGSSSVLDPNGDGYFSKYTSSGFTLSRNEIQEFEVLAGSGGDNLAWTPLPGTETPNDLNSGAGCGNTDIVTDTDGGQDFAYYTIVDPDGIAANNDEYLAFALRIADKTNGSFGFSFLIDSDNNCATIDTNSVCGNPCFEYEIQLSTSNSGGDVELYQIDGCYGTSDCDFANGGNATICAPCNSEGIQVCVDSTDCGDGGALWIYYIDFDQIPDLTSSSIFSITPASNTSGNQVIYKSANVSDYGGLDDVGGSDCNCAMLCIGDPCSNCEQDCALACSAEENSVNPILSNHSFRVNSQSLKHGIKLQWVVGYDPHRKKYVIERMLETGHFQAIGKVPSRKISNLQQNDVYSFTDNQPKEGRNIYRIKEVDLTGHFQYSTAVEAVFRPVPSLIYFDHLLARITLKKLPPSGGMIRFISIHGELIISQEWKMGESSIQLSTGTLSKGMYLVEVLPWGQSQFLQKVSIM